MCYCLDTKGMAANLRVSRPQFQNADLGRASKRGLYVCIVDLSICTYFSVRMTIERIPMTRHCCRFPRENTARDERTGLKHNNVPLLHDVADRWFPYVYLCVSDTKEL